MAQHIGIYVRISRDRAGRAENVDVQEQHARAYASKLWPDIPVKVYCDNDLSAADPNTFRPSYAELLHDIALGKVAQVVSADQDRLTRQPSEWEELMPALVTAGITETHGYRDGVTSVELGKRAYGRFKALMGADYVEGLKVKLNEKLDSLASQGRPGGGNAFGYRRTVNERGEKALEVDPVRAEAIRWAADAVLAGWSLTDVARELETRGVPTALGGKWTYSNVRGMLTAPTTAGLRVHRGEIVGRGNWDPILDEVTWKRVCDALGKPRRVRTANGSQRLVTGRHRTGRKYLLTGGVAVCGRPECGAAMVGRQQNGRGGHRPIYFCSRSHGGCNRLGINAMPLEEHVRDELIAWLSTPEFVAAMAADENEARRQALVDELQAIEQQDVDLSRRWAAGTLREAAWDAARAELDARHAVVSEQLASLPPAVVALDPEALRLGWEEMHLGEKRQVVASHIERVTILPAKPGAKVFDPDRVRIRFVGQ